MGSDRWRALGIGLGDDDRVEPCSEDARPLCKVCGEASVDGAGRGRLARPLEGRQVFAPTTAGAVPCTFIADPSLDQVASVMGCENGTVKAHLWRARQHLPRYMGGG